MEPEDFGGDGLQWRWRADVPLAEQAAADRIAAGLREVLVNRAMFNVAASETAKALQNFHAAWLASEVRLSAQEADEIAAHPDLAELNVALDGFYA